MSQEEAHERAVIASYREQLIQLASRISADWAQFDDEPGDYNVILELRSLRGQLQNALRNYYAARGSRSGEGIESILYILEDTEVRLAKLDNEVLAEVERFEQATMEIAQRFSLAQHPEEKLDVCADADDGLIELELYRESWLHIMDSDLHTRLMHTNSVLREIVATCAPIAHHASVTNVSHQSLPNGDPRMLSYPEALQQRNERTQSQADGLMQVRTDFDSYAEVRRHQKQHEMYQGFTNENPVFGDCPNTTSLQTVAIGHRDTSTGVPPTRQSGLGPPADERRDTPSSESGDEGAMQMVMSRTRTLRDMAVHAMSQRDDFQGIPPKSSPIAATDALKASSRIPSYSRGYSSQGSRQDSMSRSYAASMSGDMEQPSMEYTHNMSFASTLYHTRNERVEAISDVGVYLRRSNVRGDGRCLFRSLVRCRAVAKGKSILGERHEREEADVMRKRTVAELVKNRELLARFFVIEGNFAQYIRKMSQPRTYGGEPELLMLAKILHIPIAVYISKKAAYCQIQVYGKQYRGEPLRILYSDGIHYDALLSSS